MSHNCLAGRIAEFISLNDTECRSLTRLEKRERAVRRGAILVSENEPLHELFILRSGMMMSYVLLDDGGRQILRFLFPGDMLATAAMVYGRAPETIAALADSVVCPFDRAALAELIATQPRMSAAMMVLNQMERIALTDRLAGIGRTSAKTRVATLLLEIRDSRRRNDPAIGDTFVLGLTQEEIGDATGLTAVHVNRMMRQLEEERLIARDNGRVRFIDETRLRRCANYIDRYAGIDLGWLRAPA